MKGHIFLKFIERVQSFFDLSLWPVSCLRSCEEKKIVEQFLHQLYVSMLKCPPAKQTLFLTVNVQTIFAKKNLYKVPTPTYFQALTLIEWLLFINQRISDF